MFLDGSWNVFRDGQTRFQKSGSIEPRMAFRERSVNQEQDAVEQTCCRNQLFTAGPSFFSTSSIGNLRDRVSGHGTMLSHL